MLEEGAVLRTAQPITRWPRLLLLSGFSCSVPGGHGDNGAGCAGTAMGRRAPLGGGCCTPLLPAPADLVSRGQGCPILGSTSRL